MKRPMYAIPFSAIAVLIFVSAALAQTNPDQSAMNPYASPAQGTSLESTQPPTTVQHTESLNIEPWGFYPAHMQIEPGTTVSWFNIDSRAHTVTADDGSFDSGTLRSNETFDHTFDTPGKWTYHSELDPDMTGSITVLDPSQTTDNNSTPADNGSTPSESTPSDSSS